MTVAACETADLSLQLSALLKALPQRGKEMRRPISFMLLPSRVVIVPPPTGAPSPTGG